MPSDSSKLFITSMSDLFELVRRLLCNLIVMHLINELLLAVKSLSAVLLCRMDTLVDMVLPMLDLLEVDRLLVLLLLSTGFLGADRVTPGNQSCCIWVSLNTVDDFEGLHGRTSWTLDLLLRYSFLLSRG